MCLLKVTGVCRVHSDIGLKACLCSARRVVQSTALPLGCIKVEGRQALIPAVMALVYKVKKRTRLRPMDTDTVHCCADVLYLQKSGVAEGTAGTIATGEAHTA